MSKAAKLDKLLEKKRFGDEYVKPADDNPFRPKVEQINFNLNEDCVNGVFELDDNYKSPDEETGEVL